jgi:hypothetical protein
LYLRLRPLAGKSFDLQVGKVPTVFGAFARRSYADDNPLIGWPLAYQYLTTVRADAVPGSADDLLAVRGRGWSVPDPSGSYPEGQGLPLVSGSKWDTGVELRLGSSPVEAALALTQGTLSDPHTQDNNDGKQISGRLAVTPLTGLVIGGSGSSGEYLSRILVDELDPGYHGSYRQRALGFDFEYSRGHFLARSEVVVSFWDVPVLGPPPIDSPLRATAVFLEARWRAGPAFSLAARVDHLGFSEIQGTRRRDTWDANVTRVEVGGSWRPWRHALLKAVYQHDRRDTLRFGKEDLVAGQLVLWF